VASQAASWFPPCVQPFRIVEVEEIEENRREWWYISDVDIVSTLAGRSIDQRSLIATITVAGRKDYGEVDRKIGSVKM
jgi:hypothetical protein